MRDLPPLLSLRAFDAAARHCSFAKAGEEICVSPGAIGHQVKLLEQWLGCALFLRKPRSVELTDAGASYHEQLRQSLEELELISAQAKLRAKAPEVTVSAMPSFVTRWLMPRLGRFRTAFPEIEVRLLASVPPVDFARDRVDIAVRLGAGPYPGLNTRPLLGEKFYAVSSPALLKRGTRALKLEQLIGMTLLHDEFEPRIPDQIDWDRWLKRQSPSIRLNASAKGLRFSHTYLALDAAAAGQGIALASDVLAADAIRAGVLAIGPGRPVAGPYRYHLIASPTAMPRPQVAAFTEWLCDEASAFERGRKGSARPA
jgi:LysR family transcriptional regulator, glycine cleavage system transcriptional activator